MCDSCAAIFYDVPTKGNGWARSLIALGVLALAGCFSPIETLPSTNDARAARAPWVAQAHAEARAFAAYEHRQECDPLYWSNTAQDPSQHPECR
jgi:hypothetical protein